MADISLLNPQGKSSRSLTVSDAVFAAPVKPHVIRLAVNAQLANRRAGTQSTKTRGFVSGGGKKPFKQKGTGRARQGTTRAPHMRHGAIVHGPLPRSWRQRLNAKVRRQAIVGALSSLNQSGNIKVIESWGFENPKTKDMAALLGRLGVNTGKVLLLLSEPDKTAWLSARNLAGVTIASTEEINVFDLITHDAIVATEAAIRRLEQLFAGDEVTAEVK